MFNLKCFGMFWSKCTHADCDKKYDCIATDNKENSLCNCEFVASCNIPRQRLRVEYTGNDKTKCDCYPLLLEITRRK